MSQKGRKINKRTITKIFFTMHYNYNNTRITATIMSDEYLKKAEKETRELVRRYFLLCTTITTT